MIGCFEANRASSLETLLTLPAPSQDPSNQNYRPPPPSAPGPIQQTTLATQKAALQTLGLTGAYLEYGLRLFAEDVGWLTHTATFEEAVRGISRRFPVIGRLGQSYGEGAREEVRRRSGWGFGCEFALRAVGVEVRAEPAGSDGVVVEGLRPAAAERFRIAELEDVPLQSSGEDGDDEGDELEDGEWDPLDSQHVFAATR